MRTRHSIECWIERADGQVLLLHVSAEESPPYGFWQPITGGIEEGETAVAAVVREIREETGMTLAPRAFDLVTEGLLVPIDENMQVIKSVFVTRVDRQGIVTNPREHDDHAWYPKDDVEGALTWRVTGTRGVWSVRGWRDPGRAGMCES